MRFYGGENVDSGKILAIIGYLLAIFFPLIGIIYGLILYFAKGDDAYIKKHAKYIIIIGVILLCISFVLMMVFNISMFAFYQFA